LKIVLVVADERRHLWSAKMIRKKKALFSQLAATRGETQKMVPTPTTAKEQT